MAFEDFLLGPLHLMKTSWGVILWIEINDES